MRRAERGLGPIVDALRPLRLNGTLRSVMHIGNDYKVLTASGRFPWASVTGDGVLGEDAMVGAARAARHWRLERIGRALWHARAGARGAGVWCKRALAGKVNRLRFIDDRRLGLMGRFATPFRLVDRPGRRVGLLKVSRPVYGLLKGHADGLARLRRAYWRKTHAVPDKGPDPDRDGCGLLWCSPSCR